MRPPSSLSFSLSPSDSTEGLAHLQLFGKSFNAFPLSKERRRGHGLTDPLWPQRRLSPNEATARFKSLRNGVQRAAPRALGPQRGRAAPWISVLAAGRISAAESIRRGRERGNGSGEAWLAMEGPRQDATALMAAGDFHERVVGASTTPARNRQLENHRVFSANDPCRIWQDVAIP